MNLEDMKDLKKIRRTKKTLQYTILALLCDPCSMIYPGVETRLTELRNQLIELDEMEKAIIERDNEEYDEKMKNIFFEKGGGDWKLFFKIYFLKIILIKNFYKIIYRKKGEGKEATAITISFYTNSLHVYKRSYLLVT